MTVGRSVRTSLLLATFPLAYAAKKGNLGVLALGIVLGLVLAVIFGL